MEKPISIDLISTQKPEEPKKREETCVSPENGFLKETRFLK
ncbi:MAG: hypothetical protein ACKPHE_09100 [Microcystis panniformis]